ncbi:MAG: cytochrome P460 family protein, partial [Chloroflexota bacterium]
APQPAPTVAPLTAPGADVDRVDVPQDYRTRFFPFYVFDRADNRQVRAVYVNRIGAQVREGQPYPYGTILVMETYRAQLEGDQIALDEQGRFIRGDQTGIFAMRKERGFGEKYGPDRTGEWEYVAYRPDFSSFLTPPERTLACAQCHLATSDAQKDWVVRANLFFAGRPSIMAGLPRTGHGAAGALPSLTPFALAAGAPALGLAALALRSLVRRR